MKADNIVVKAKLTLYPTEKGGRIKGITSGYRPNHIFEYKENSTDFVSAYMGQIDFEKEVILPGQSVSVKVYFPIEQNIAEWIKIGRTWWIQEGQRKIGEGIITEILTK